MCQGTPALGASKFTPHRTPARTHTAPHTHEVTRGTRVTRLPRLHSAWPQSHHMTKQGGPCPSLPGCVLLRAQESLLRGRVHRGHSLTRHPSRGAGDVAMLSPVSRPAQLPPSWNTGNGNRCDSITAGTSRASRGRRSVPVACQAHPHPAPPRALPRTARSSRRSATRTARSSRWSATR